MVCRIRKDLFYNTPRDLPAPLVDLLDNIYGETGPYIRPLPGGVIQGHDQ
jgi:hypothetical protein